ncbi:MAG: sigma 54-interacting transcriptional regulator [Deltaproteobacteria bacterium]|nr:sigma 54-interacting transcriptional regulator [Deltaproteobacteria bacterium]MBW2447633.1 sigma 54-interacting transcriptional regulator [Deltaproteobacteria bacterium]
MGKPASNPPRALILAVAPDERRQQAIAARLAPEFAVRPASSADLGGADSWVDAHGAVVWLEPGHDARELSALRDLPAGRALILLMEDEDEDRLDLAIETLRPQTVLSTDAPAAALRLSLGNALPSENAGEGARQNHRRAPALLGVSQAIRDLMEEVRRLAASNIQVLILGETGTGKELVARAIHEQSPRAGRNFVAVNCGALPDTLLESELFGHVRGAFTGADRDKRGLFEEAEGGTLLLDEVGDTSPAFQTKLLRVLEEREIRPVGGTETRRVDVRVVSATHRDLAEMVTEGTFRQDLLYRLNTAVLYVPPLRRRRVDIPFLAQHFAEEFGDEHARKILLDESFLDGLARQEFPGNVRELRNAVERAIALTAPGELVGETHLMREAEHVPPETTQAGTLRERLDAVERDALRDALDRFHGNRTRMAEALGLSRVGLRNKLRRHGLDEVH